MSVSDLENTSISVSNDDMDLTKLSAEELLAVVAELRQENKTLLKFRNKVGLTFKRIPEDGNESIAKLEEGQFPYLTKIESLSVVKEEKNDGNIALIEGENLAVLAALQMTHKSKVDVIYIDPPYNTGNDDFIYEDKRMYKSDESDLENLEDTLDGKARTVGKDDPFRHSKWLSFMERRLFLARELLSETGVIFVSIGDEEQAHLKLLMDQIFGADNFIETILVELSGTQGMKVKAAQNGKIVKNGEFILVYARTNKAAEAKRTPLYDNVVGYDKHFNLYLDDDLNIFNIGESISRNAVLKSEAEATFGAKGLPSKITLEHVIELTRKSPIIERYVYGSGAASIYRTMLASLQIPEDIKNKLNYKTATKYTSKDGKNYLLVRLANGTINQLMPLSTTLRTSDDFYPKHGRSVIRGDFWKGFHKDMMNISKEGEVEFKNGKKPVRLIKQLTKWAVGANPHAIVLDFFAGSGTTGHAVAELNKEDGGNRSTILVTNNEGGIARNVTRERLARVLSGQNWADGKVHEPLPGNLSYYRLDFKSPSSNPLTTAQMLESKFDGLLSLENNALTVVENSSDEDYAIYRNSSKIVFIWKNLFSLYDGEFEELLESLKATSKATEVVAYVPSESGDAGISVDGWKVITFPHGYIERYGSMIATMRRNQTLPNSK